MACSMFSLFKSRARFLWICAIPLFLLNSTSTLLEMLASFSLFSQQLPKLNPNTPAYFPLQHSSTPLLTMSKRPASMSVFQRRFKYHHSYTESIACWETGGTSSNCGQYSTASLPGTDCLAFPYGVLARGAPPSRCAPSTLLARSALLGREACR